MSAPSDEDPLEQLLAAFVDGSQSVAALLAGIDAGAPDLGIERSRWERSMTRLEWFVTELLTNDLVQCGPFLRVGGLRARQLMKGGHLITEESIERIRTLKERASDTMQSGAGGSELRPLALVCLEMLLGPSWREHLRTHDDQGALPT